MNLRYQSPDRQRRSRPVAGAAETNDKRTLPESSREVNLQGLVYEGRDEVVMRHALRLGVVGKLLNAPPEATLRQVIVGDGETVRLLMNHVGRADGDNGLAMIAVPNQPGAAEMLRRLAMANLSGTPLVGGLN